MADPTGGAGDVANFLATVPDARRRADIRAATDLLREVTGVEPTLWSGGIIGFGTHHYRYATGREGDTMVVGLAPRRQALTFYGLDVSGSADATDPMLARLGPHTAGKGCLYVKDLSRVDLSVLRAMMEKAWTARQAETSTG